MGQLTRGGRAIPEQDEFYRVIAQLIVFKTAEALHGELGYQGYRAQAVAYAVARLSHALERRIPWHEIWIKQVVPAWLKQALKVLLVAARDVITSPPGGRNVTEWCKKEECWHALLERDITLKIPEDLVDTLAGGTTAGSATAAATDALIRAVGSVSSEVWYATAKWAKDTDSLQPWQRSLAYTLGTLTVRTRLPSQKQAVQGAKLLSEARKKGFVHTQLTDDLMGKLQSVDAS
jgi:hypothetical protein